MADRPGPRCIRGLTFLVEAGQCVGYRSWLPSRCWLTIAQQVAHKNYRCFWSSPPLTYMHFHSSPKRHFQQCNKQKNRAVRFLCGVLGDSLPRTRHFRFDSRCRCCSTVRVAEDDTANRWCSGCFRNCVQPAAPSLTPLYSSPMRPAQSVGCGERGCGVVRTTIAKTGCSRGTTGGIFRRLGWAIVEAPSKKGLFRS
jgi:hypothetical protein